MDIKIIFLILVPLATAFLIPLIDLINAKLRRFFVLLGIFLESYLIFNIISSNFESLKSGDFFLEYYLGGWHPPLGISLVMDGLSLLFVSITALSLF